jgi:hypothetical protein
MILEEMGSLLIVHCHFLSLASQLSLSLAIVNVQWKMQQLK